MQTVELKFSIPSTKTIDAPIAFVACALIALVCGCGSRAHNDLYRQRMAGKIRVLEDQLYDADYQNRVLRDKVIRLQKKEAERPSKIEPEIAVPRVFTPPMTDVPSLDDVDMGDSLEVPFVDEGEVSELPPPVKVPGADDRSDEGESGDKLLPPPGGPEPPGMEELKLPDVFEGEPSPPPAEGQDDDKPLGQIQLPGALQSKAMPVPQTLRIHQGLSGGHHFDGEPDVAGLYLVINAIDRQGKIVDWTRFDVDAALTVVALDPKRDPSEARIGRWEYNAKQLQELIRNESTSGLHIPVRWQAARPSGEDVIVHVRLRGDDEEMRCEAAVKVSEAAAVAEWTPRGERL